MAVPVLHAAWPTTSRWAPSPPSTGFVPDGGRDRVVGHLDDQLRGQASELHVQVDGLHHLSRRSTRRSRSGSARHPRRARRASQRIATADKALGCHRIRSSATTTTQRIRVLEARVLLEHAACRTAATTAGTTARTTTTGSQAWTEIKVMIGGASIMSRAVEAADAARQRREEVGGPQARRPLPRPPRLQVRVAAGRPAAAGW